MAVSSKQHTDWSQNDRLSYEYYIKQEDIWLKLHWVKNVGRRDARRMC